MTRAKIDIVDEFVLLRRENDRLRKRLDRIDVLFNQASNIVEILKLEISDARRSIELIEQDFMIQRTDK